MSWSRLKLSLEGVRGGGPGHRHRRDEGHWGAGRQVADRCHSDVGHQVADRCHWDVGHQVAGHALRHRVRLDRHSGVGRAGGVHQGRRRGGQSIAGRESRHSAAAAVAVVEVHPEPAGQVRAARRARPLARAGGPSARSSSSAVGDTPRLPDKSLQSRERSPATEPRRGGF